MASADYGALMCPDDACLLSSVVQAGSVLQTSSRVLLQGVFFLEHSCMHRCDCCVVAGHLELCNCEIVFFEVFFSILLHLGL